MQKKKWLPAAVAAGMIVVIILIGVATGLLERYSYSTQKADLNAYYDIAGDTDAAIILNDELMDADAILQDGICYLPIDFVNEHINNHFYYDTAENLLLFTTDTDLVKTAVGTSEYTVSDTFSQETYALSIQAADTVYLAADYVRKFANFEFALYNNPNRVLLTTAWESESVASISKDTQIRVLGGVKSEIVAEVSKGTEVKLLESMDNWSKVMTADGWFGYVENKRLSEQTERTPQAVNDVAVPEYSSIRRDGKLCLVWNMVTNPTANGLIDDLLAQTQGVNVVSPTWFSLNDNMGNFSSLADAAYVSNMHSRGIEVWALVDNFTNQVDTAAILNATTSRTNLINQLMNMVQSYGIDGINVDFEQVSAEAAGGYIEFLRELSIRCRQSGIVLSADNSYLVNYDRKKQAEVVDYVVIMGYDEHVSAADGPGSTASIDFVQSGIEKTIALVPEEKVINGIPFYTRLWTTTGDIGNTAYGMGEIEKFLSNNGIQTTWDDVTCQYKADFTIDGTGYSVWLDEEESIAVKLNIMSQYNLAGVAGWRLGQEKADIWDEIMAYLQK